MSEKFCNAFTQTRVWVGYVIFLENVLEGSVVICRVMHAHNVKVD